MLEQPMKFPGNFWEISGKFPGKFPGHFQEISGKFPGNVQETSGKFAGNVQDMSGNVPEMFQDITRKGKHLDLGSSSCSNDYSNFCVTPGITCFLCPPPIYPPALFPGNVLGSFNLC